MSTESPHLCGCGCGQPVAKARGGRYNKFIHGHNSKTDSPSSNASSTRFQPGNKHGKGRPQGSRNKVTISAQNIIDDQAAVITEKAVEMALNGDRSMIKMIVERIVPVRRSVPVKLPDMPKVHSVTDASKLTEYLLNAVATGKLSPVDSEIISRSCERHLKALQVGDLEARLAELESQLLDTPRQ